MTFSILNTFSLFTLSLFTISLFGILISETAIAFLISLEMLFLSISLRFILYSVLHNDIIGQLYAISILSIAGAESAIALGIILIFSRVSPSINLNKLNTLKG